MLPLRSTVPAVILMQPRPLFHLPHWPLRRGVRKVLTFHHPARTSAGHLLVRRIRAKHIKDIFSHYSSSFLTSFAFGASSFVVSLVISAKAASCMCLNCGNFEGRVPSMILSSCSILSQSMFNAFPAIPQCEWFGYHPSARYSPAPSESDHRGSRCRRYRWRGYREPHRSDSPPQG